MFFDVRYMNVPEFILLSLHLSQVQQLVEAGCKAVPSVTAAALLLILVVLPAACAAAARF